MRVHLFARDFPPSGTKFGGGLDKAVHGLAGGLVGHGAHVTVLCNGREKGSRKSPSGYDIISFGVTEHWGISLPEELEAYIRNYRGGGVFVLNGVFNPTVYAVSRACARKRIPYFCWPHDPYHSSQFVSRGYLKWPYWYLFERRMLREATGIQVFSSTQEGWLRELGVGTPTLAIVNGHASEDVLPESALSWRLKGPPRLLFLGRIDCYNKAIDIMIDAFAAIKEQTDAVLTIQGPDWGDLKAVKERAARLGLGDRIQFKAPDFTREASQIMADHDVFLLPSRFEGFALAALEAMCSARVLMVSEVNGIASYVESAGCGVVVTPDVESVRAGLLRLLACRIQWKDMGIAGRNFALSNFRWDKVAKGILSQYGSLAGAA